jgi:ABC-type multidrug transport system fused ATPase/permease subunit
LRQRVFDRTLDSDVFHQRGLVRSSIVSRHSSDVDAIGEAVEQTIVSGVPGMIRVVIALSLLTVIEWRAGVAMAAATVPVASFLMESMKYLRKYWTLPHGTTSPY